MIPDISRFARSSSARRLLLVAALSLAVAAPVHAQSRPIVVAIPDAFPTIDARAVVLRSAERDVVLLPSDGATVDALAVSLLTLRRARERRPDPIMGEMIPVTGFVVHDDRPTEHRRSLARLLERLERRPSTNVGDFGPGRWVHYQGG